MFSHQIVQNVICLWNMGVATKGSVEYMRKKLVVKFQIVYKIFVLYFNAIPRISRSTRTHSYLDISYVMKEWEMRMKRYRFFWKMHFLVHNGDGYMCLWWTKIVLHILRNWIFYMWMISQLWCYFDWLYEGGI